MTIRDYTIYNQFELPYYDIPGWHQYIDRNFEAIDGMFYMFTGATNIRGIWKNNTVYHVGDRAIDNLANTIWQCNLQHTSSLTGTFVQFRTNFPTYWSLTELYPSTVSTRIEFTNSDPAVTTTDASVEFRGGIGVAKNIIAGSWVAIASNDAYGIAVGRLGRTNPAFAVNGSDVASVTGILITGKPINAGAEISVLSTIANESLHINAKGTGTITLGDVSTGPIGIVSPLQITNQVSINTTSPTAFTVGTGGNYMFRVQTDGLGAVNGLLVLGTAAGNGITLMALSPAANESIAIYPKGTGRLSVTGPADIVANDGVAFSVGVGANYMFRVSTSQPGAVTGIMIYGGPAGNGVAITALSPAGSEDIIIDAKGSGRILISVSPLEVRSVIASTAYTNGAFICRGGVGIYLNLNVGGTLTTLGDISMGVGTKIAINTQQVVGARVMGWGTQAVTPADRSAFDPTTVTLPQLANRVAAIMIDLRAHGLIGT